MCGKPLPCLTLCVLLWDAESGSDQGWPTLLTRDRGPRLSSRIHFMLVSHHDHRYDDDDSDDDYDQDDYHDDDHHPN